MPKLLTADEIASTKRWRKDALASLRKYLAAFDKAVAQLPLEHRKPLLDCRADIESVEEQIRKYDNELKTDQTFRSAIKKMTPAVDAFFKNPKAIERDVLLTAAVNRHLKRFSQQDRLDIVRLASNGRLETVTPRAGKQIDDALDARAVRRLLERAAERGAHKDLAKLNRYDDLKAAKRNGAYQRNKLTT